MIDGDEELEVEGSGIDLGEEHPAGHAFVWKGSAEGPRWGGGVVGVDRGGGGVWGGGCGHREGW